MADKTIPQLVEATTVTGNGLVVVDTGVQTYKMKVSNLAKAVAPYALPIVTQAAGTLDPVTASRYYIDTTAGAITLVLPVSASIVAGFYFEVKDVAGMLSVNEARVQRFAGTSFEGLSTTYYYMSADYGSWRFEFDGTNWFVK